jgi:spermidine synthase
VITSEPMPPHHAGVVNLYSMEYYRLAQKRLEPGGFVVQWLPIHLLAVDESLQILKTVQEVFPETTLWLHRETGIIVARRDGPVLIDLGRVARALEPGPLRDELENLGIQTPLDFARLYAIGPDEVRAATSAVAPVTDDRPSLEFHQFRHPLQQYRGPFNEEQARMMRVIYRWRADSDAPLSGATPSQAAKIASWRIQASKQGLADIRAQWGPG